MSKNRDHNQCEQRLLSRFSSIKLGNDCKKSLIKYDLSDDKKTFSNLKKFFNDFKLKINDKINKDNVVVVKADKEIDHGFVVQIMDLIKRSGFKKLGIAVTKQE